MCEIIFEIQGTQNLNVFKINFKSMNSCSLLNYIDHLIQFLTDGDSSGAEP